MVRKARPTSDAARATKPSAAKPKAPAPKPEAARAAVPAAVTSPRSEGEAAGTHTNRESAVEAFMALLGEQSFETIGFADVASGAGLSLADLRAEFGSKLAMLAAYVKATDRAVLATDFSDMHDEPARERLFDVLMRRFELQTPHKDAIRSLMRSAQTNPGLALALNNMALGSQQWMLTAANIPAHGPLGALRAQGLVFLYTNVMQTWFDDDEPGQARTMAALDRALGRGQQIIGMIDQVGQVVPNIATMLSAVFRFGTRGREHASTDDHEGDQDRRDGIHPPPDRTPPRAGDATVTA